MQGGTTPACYNNILLSGAHCCPGFSLSPSNQGQDFLRKCNDNPACHSENTIGPLAGVVAFQRQTDLEDAEAQQDQTDGSNQAEYKVRKVVDNCQRIGLCKHGGAEHRDYHGGGGKDQVEALCLFVVIVFVQECSFLAWLIGANNGVPI